MTWRVALVLATGLSSPALAAGGWDDMPAPFVVAALLWMVLLFGLPCVGLGFFLQAFVRFWVALLLLACGLLVLAGWAVTDRGLDRTIELAPLLAVASALFVSLFGVGWLAGIWAANRQTKHQELA